MSYKQNLGAVTVTASTVTVTRDAHAGVPIVLNRAAGCAATLPAATGSGARFEFILAADASGDQVVKVANSSDTMMGVAYLGNDSAGASCFYTGDTSDTITMDGTTKGGKKGARIVCDDIAANIWAVLVYSEASGTEATPFSAGV